ncbi:MAG: putative bifunctional diguanylate cyclase/phosphodiesterase [Steroidobacteraceae bacterium]
MRLTGMAAWCATRAQAQRAFASLAQGLEALVEAPSRACSARDARRARAQLHRLARAARASGLLSFSSVVLHLAERLEPCLRAGQIGARDRALVRRLTVQCSRYLEDPADERAAAGMVEALASGPMPAADRAERAQLLQGALEQGAYLLDACSTSPDAAPPRRCDALTGLVDRAALAVRLADILAAAAAAHRTVGVLSIGISGVEDIVDSLGAEFGTTILARMARVLIGEAAPEDTLGRLGPDHFVLVRCGLTARELTDSASALVARLGRSRRIGPHLLSVSARIGLAMTGAHGLAARELLANADAALHDARARRLYSTQMFVPHMRQAALRRVSLEAQLRAAIEAEHFELHYQPKLSLCAGRLSGLEALVRWRHGPQGAVGPAEFIPIAEESGLIIPLGQWVLEEACRQLGCWRRDGVLDVPVAVNLSSVQLCSCQMHEHINAALQRHGVAPSLLEVEITESALMRDAGAALRCLGELGRLGVRVAIDDFGTGYSNLSQLMRLPLAALKIDRSLVAGIVTRTRDAAILRAIIDMARSIGARVVAEGVEHPRQRDWLAAAGCDEYQGYLIARPMDAARLQVWLTRRRADDRVVPAILS